ncbi:MAG: FkbM family methyltransferase [Planctomycetota bacterium]|jgi:FkbM family methyltransferase
MSILIKNCLKRIKNTRKKAFYIITGNKIAQKHIARRIRKLQILAGIGSGGSVESSGEKSIFKKLKSLKQDSYCLFDVGANKGDFTKLILDFFNNDHIEVHSFEPSKATFKLLSNNIKSDKVILNNKGLGREAGIFPFYTGFPGSGTASLTKRKMDCYGVDFDYSEDVSIDTLDDYCLSNDIKEIDLLKIDVEGHELDVLEGSKEMLKRKTIRMISFEFGGCNIDTKIFLRDFYYLFNELGFLLYRITPSGYFYLLGNYSEKLEMFRTTNYIGIRQDVAKELF